MRLVNIILFITIALAALCAASIGTLIACRIATLPISAPAYEIGLTGLLGMVLTLALAIILAQSIAISQSDVVILPTKSPNDNSKNSNRLVIKLAAPAVNQDFDVPLSTPSVISGKAPLDNSLDDLIAPTLNAAIEMVISLAPASAALWIVSLGIRIAYPLAAIPIAPNTYGIGLGITIGAFAAISLLAFWAQTLFGHKGKIRLVTTQSEFDALT